ncbi:MAG: hypothetical protein STHCBS139747_000130 [Sporothrix thermara]
MSADLFAQFGPFSGNNAPANQQQGQNQPQAPAPAQQTDDPFAFLSTAFSQPPQQLPQPPRPQPQLQPQTTQFHTGQPQQWSFGAPSPAPQVAGVWGGGGSGGGSGGGGWSNWNAAMTAKPAAPEVQDDDDEDTWGDFEDASTNNPAQFPPMPAPQGSQVGSNGPPPSQSSKPGTRVVRASTIDLISNTLIDFGDLAPKMASQQPAEASRQQSPPRQDPWRNPAPQPAPKPRKPADPNVLFDAEDFELNGSSDDDDFDADDDEFGDFETGHTSPPAQPVPTPAAATALIDLLSLADPEPAASTAATAANSVPSQPKASPSTNGQAPSYPSSLSFGSTAPAITQTPSFAATKKSVPQLDEADWDAWGADESQSSQPAPVQAKKAPSQPKSQAKSQLQPKSQPPAKKERKVAKPEPKTSDWDWEAEEPSQSANSSAATALPPAIANAPTPKTIPEKAPPPTNIPPPSVLLSLFPTLIALPDKVLFKPTAAQPAEVRNRVIGDPKTVAFLRNYLQIIVVAGRVIAGRKQRWHRDKFLSQSMSISAAGSSKGGGMKLAGLDKAQGQREDREAADVVAAWARHVGKLRSAVATANAALVAAEAAEHKHYPPLKIPELQSATIPVTVAKQVPTATKPCIICGLRRDERVRGIDGDDVEDIFSEWWVEHWGHRVCRNFWAEHEATLRSR